MLDISDTPLKELPEGLTVGGFLNLSRTNIKSLPKKLTVGTLYLIDTNITELPKDLVANRVEMKEELEGKVIKPPSVDFLEFKKED